MALETFTIDHASDGGTSPLQLMGSANYSVTSFSAPGANPKPLWSANIDTNGARRADPGTYENRTLTLTIEAHDTGGLSTHEDAARAKVAKVHREGATARWVRKDGSVRVFHLLAGDQFSLVRDLKYENGRAEMQLQFTALPETRGASVLQTDRVETTLPCLIATETGITGDVPAGGSFVIDNDAGAGNDWWGVEFGFETDTLYTFTDSTGSGALFYQAESRTALGGAAIAAGPSGASGAGSNVMRHTSLPLSFVAVLSTQASGGGAHLTHVGPFNVYARVQVPTSNTGTVSVALEWGVGDFRVPTQGPTRTIDPSWEGSWRRVDLGQVTIPKVLIGTQRWEGRIVAKSTVLGDDIDIDWIELVPVAECWGRAEAVLRAPSPTSFVARDEFDQTAGALNAKVAPVGGTWATSGGATDFQVSGAGTVTRNVGTETEWAGRFAILGATNYTDVAAHLDASGFNNLGTFQIGWHGLILRYVDASNWLAIVHNPGGNVSDYRLAFVKNIAGTKTTIANLPVLAASGGAGTYAIALDASVSAAGAISATLVVTGSNKDGTYTLSGQDAALATGGTLATGKPGFYSDRRNTAVTYTFDNFRASAPPPDAAVFAGQSIQIRHDGVIREDSTGSFWQPPSSPIGDYLRVPIAGAEAHSTRFIVAPLYGLETNGVRTDHRTDDMSARLTYEPRYLT